MGIYLSSLYPRPRLTKRKLQPRKTSKLRQNCAVRMCVRAKQSGARPVRRLLTRVPATQGRPRERCWRTSGLSYISVGSLFGGTRQGTEGLTQSKQAGRGDANGKQQKSEDGLVSLGNGRKEQVVGRGLPGRRE